MRDAFGANSQSRLSERKWSLRWPWRLSRPPVRDQQHSCVAVGTRVSPRAPRTDPDVQLSRIRLPPRVCDGKAIARPGMKDARFWEPVVRQLRHSCPREPILLAATPQRTPPKIGDMVPERVQSTSVGWHRVEVEVAADDMGSISRPTGSDPCPRLAAPQKILDAGFIPAGLTGHHTGRKNCRRPWTPGKEKD
jgi:hypothetical protein